MKDPDNPFALFRAKNRGRYFHVKNHIGSKVGIGNR